MKRFLFIALAALGLVACNNDGLKDTNLNSGENSYVTSTYVTPLRYADGVYFSQGTEDVQIEVTELTADNIVFMVTPSEEVLSYYVQVYPLASIYNSLLETMKSAGSSSLTVDESLNYLQEIILNSDDESSYGELMNASALGADDYASYEFDWGNSTYAQFTFLPDADYLIAVLACFDEAGEEYSDLCLVGVHTPYATKSGSPAVSAVCTYGYTSYTVNFEPNDDCIYLTYLVGEQEEIYEFIDAYDEDMYRDLIRFYGGYFPCQESDYSEYLTVENTGTAGTAFVITALAMDQFLNPADNVYFQEFTLKELIASSERVEAEGKLNTPYKISATCIRFTADLEPSCYNLYYNIYTATAGKNVMASSEEARMTEAYSLVSEGGWGINNANYAIDLETNTITGGGYYDVEQNWYGEDMTPGETYMLIWTCMNVYGDYTDLQATEPFTMKDLVRNSPATSIENLTFTIPETNRTSVTLDFTFDEEAVACYYFQYYTGYDDDSASMFSFPSAEDESARDEWLYYLIDYRDPYYNLPWSNIWFAEGESETGHDGRPYAGFDAGPENRNLCVAEDWNGVLGYLKFATCETLTNEGGENPEITAWSIDSSGKITFELNDDTCKTYYMSMNNDHANASSLMLSYLLEKSKYYDEADYLEAWETYLLGNGLTTTSTKAYATIDTTKDIVIALCMPIGAKDGEDVYGEMVALVYTPSTGLQTLSDYLK